VAVLILTTPAATQPRSNGRRTTNATLQYDRIIDLRLELDRTAIESLKAKGDNEVTGRVVVGAAQHRIGTPVTVRLKGQLGSKRSIDDKPAFKIDVKGNQRILGFEHLTLNNMVQDPTMLHETLGYRVYANVGVRVPQTTYVRLTVNGDPYGLYLLVETIDQQFLGRRFGNAAGILYEGAYGSDLNEGDEEKFELDEGKDPDRVQLKKLIAAVVAGNDSVFYGPSAQVDTKSFLSMMAVQVLINDWDNYYRSNNYRIYWNPATHRWSFIPTGIDQTFTHHKTELFGATGTLFRKCVRSERCKADYIAAVERVIEAYERMGAAATMERVWAAIARAAEADPRKPYDVEEMKAAREKMRDVISSRPKDIRAELRKSETQRD
jgi:spore coat protein CotH